MTHGCKRSKEGKASEAGWTMGEPDESKIVVREATIEDLEGVQRLGHLLAKFEYERGFDPEINPQWAFSEAGANHLKQTITGEDSVALVAISDDCVAGLLIGGMREGRRGLTGALEGMFVLPAYRRKKVGTRLVAQFLRWCELRNLDKATVAVAPANDPAIALYEQMGFEASTLILTKRN